MIRSFLSPSTDESGAPDLITFDRRKISQRARNRVANIPLARRYKNSPTLVYRAYCRDSSGGGFSKTDRA
ncbi:hypothetical protein [Microcoleus asticus]|uniref:hypothetical protein n=1 Tax=Microcoleus asticus TaxID=2815231 RepID=UPI001555E538|nr:hypothetical protein [Microcoleus asticus]